MKQTHQLISDELRENPSISSRAIAARLGVDHKTVGSVRRELEQRAEIPHVEQTTDTLGRSQPARKPIRTSFIDDSEEGKRESLQRAKMSIIRFWVL